MNPKDVTIYLQEQQITDLRAMARRAVDGEAGAIEGLRAELDALDQVDREVENEREREEYHNSPTCDCGAEKGVGTSYCPVCDAEPHSPDRNSESGDAKQAPSEG